MFGGFIFSIWVNIALQCPQKVSGCQFLRKAPSQLSTASDPACARLLHTGRSHKPQCDKKGLAKRMEGVPAAAQIWDQVSSGWFPPMMIYEYCPLMKLPMLSEGLLIGPVSFRINDGIGLQSSSHDFCPCLQMVFK